ncbi:preprotein translocase subunit SecE [Candidatus Saccharibacteria bacterium]|nr:preprotein translocase subunit SecE [Candidatus Saccharibacteria bacterium]
MAEKDKTTVKRLSKTTKVEAPKPPRNRIVTALSSIGSYLKGSWVELRQVRWPNRRATWGMTLAVLLFTALFLLLIVTLDAIFSQLFNLIIK